MSKTASEKYQKISQLEHILKRPDTYIGSIEPLEQTQWIFDGEELLEKHVTIVPGLFKIFDEILVNAADNKVRDPHMKRIDVTINVEENLIEVKNDGKGIPIEIHDKENIYIPEMIFGHLLTSSNYDDDEKKVTGGRNGYGAKLCNIFSTEFTLETADPGTGLKYVQRWENNMSVVHKASITKYKNSSSYTKVSFKPDLKRFNMEKLDDDILGVMRRRVYDMSGSVRDIAVYLNGTSLKVRNFKAYCELYIKAMNKKKNDEDKKAAILYEKVNDRWEIGFGVSEESFQQVSFVNSIATTSGGTHVNYVADQITKKVTDFLKKKKKNVKPFQIKNNMFVFINSLIENPAFTSQTKEQLTTKASAFGSKCHLSDAFINNVLKSELIEKIFEIADLNDQKTLKKTDGNKKSRITEYPKLEDANKAGTKEGYKCTLVLTEGDSALSLAVAGLAVVGRDYYGCYPLRGKMLNVREATADQQNKNAEIQAIKKIMGLQHKKQYEDVSSLRYGHIMIMTDQDHDGSHIKGLIINFLESSFPGLLNIPGFLIEFITPIIKVSIKKPKKTLAFYTMPEFEKWRDTESEQFTSWSLKYYKGLGTSTPQEAREYFSDLDKHLKRFHALQDGDPELIDLAFSKKKADDRKEWLRKFEPGTHLDPEISDIPISDFINKELILFSLADNIRSIPSVLDGFKPGQRKVLYGCFKRNLKSEIKVAQLAGYVSEHTGYHHGEQSLVQTIVDLAQDFIGSNNIYLLKPNGAFGTRATGGKDAAAPRYIFTELNKITKTIFNPSDNPLLTYVQDDEQTVEPEWYLPVLPMILVNGTEGIGTGWSTNIPSFNPTDIVANIRRLMNDESLEEMVPWFRGWNGLMERVESQKYRMYGRIEQVDNNTIEITELPAKTWTSNIKEYLLQGLSGTDKIKPWIKDMQEQHGIGIKFVVTLSDEEMEKTRKMGFYERFKLVSSVSLSNMVAFDPQGKIKKYETVNEILSDFYYVRLEYYQKRKDFMCEQLKWQLEKLSQQARFIKMIFEGEIIVSNKKKAILTADMEKHNFPRIDKDGKPHFGSVKIEDDGLASLDDLEEAEEEIGDNVNTIESKYGSYDYLLGMQIWSLTHERYMKLLEQRNHKSDELELLLSKSAKDLWNEDLDTFNDQFQSFLEYDEEVRNNMVPDAAGNKVKAKRKRKDNDDDYGVKKKKVTKPAALKTSNFARVLIEPKVVPVKVKKERTPKQTLDGMLKKENTPSVKSETPSTATSTVTNTDATKIESDDEFSKLTSKFKAASTAFNDVVVIDDDDVKPIAKKVTTEKAAPKKVAPKTTKKTVLTDESDLDEEPIIIERKARSSRGSTKSYVVEQVQDSADDWEGSEDEDYDVPSDEDYL